MHRNFLFRICAALALLFTPHAFAAGHQVDAGFTMIRDPAKPQDTSPHLEVIRVGLVDATGAEDNSHLIRTDSPHMQPMINPAANVLYSAQAADIDTVICDGKMIMHGRELLTLDKKTIMAEVRSRVERLNQPTPGRRIQTYHT